MYAISSEVEAGLLGTITVPVRAAASQNVRNSRQFPRWMLNFSCGSSPRRSRKCAARFTSRSNSRNVCQGVARPSASS